MRVKKLLLLFLSVVLAIGLLTACGGSTYSSELRIAINDAQTILDLAHSGQLDRALRKALADYQAGEDFNVIRDRVIEELGLEDVVYFSSSGVSNARDGQHAVQVFRIEGGTSDNAIDQLSAQIAETLKALTSGGQYDGTVSMIEKDGVFYAVVDLHIIQSGSGTSGGGGGKPAVTLTSIAVTTPPTKTEYYVMSTEQSIVFPSCEKPPAILRAPAKRRTESYADSAPERTWRPHGLLFAAALQSPGPCRICVLPD